MNLRTSIVLAACAGVAAAADCDKLAEKVASTTSAQVVAAGAFTPPSGPKAPVFKTTPEFCRVQGVLTPSADSHIEFEVWLPVSGWNGKYLGVGNGGFAGSIGYTALAEAVANGYAASSTDTGHKGGATDGVWALGHHEKMVDYGNRAIHVTAEKTKEIVAAFYGGAPKHSYFASCSNGGRQALLEAQRYPADYDGIIAGAPANYFTHVAAGFVWNAQALDGAGYIPPAKLKLIESAALASCDAKDGVTDGVIDDPTKCHFDPSDAGVQRRSIGHLPDRTAGCRSQKDLCRSPEFQGPTAISRLRARRRNGSRRMGRMDYRVLSRQERRASLRERIFRRYDVPGHFVGFSQDEF